MNKNTDSNNSGSRGQDTISRTERNSSVPNDLPDSERDADELKTEEIILNLPDVKDIPGQEFVNVPPLSGIADTTISSSDEEGGTIFDRDDELQINRTTSSVSREERQALEDTTYLPTKDEDNLRDASLDNTDFDGEILNE